MHPPQPDVVIRQSPATALALAAALCLLGPIGLARSQEIAPAPAPPETPSPAQEATPAQPAEAPKESPGYGIFRDAAEKVRAAREITFDSRCYGTGDLESMSQSSTASVRMLKDDSGKWLVRVTGSGRLRSKENENFDAAWRSETIEFVDHAGKKVVERRTKEARGPAFQMANGSRVEEIASLTPFSKALSSSSIELRDMESADGVDCEVLILTSGDKKTKTKWLLGAEDRMPRRVERILEGSKFSGSMVIELTKVKASGTATLTPSDMRVLKPADYTEDRQLPVSAQTPAPTDGSDAEKIKMEKAGNGAENPAGLNSGDVPSYKLERPLSGESGELDQSEPGQVKPIDPIMEREKAANAPAPASEPAPANPATPATPATLPEAVIPANVPPFELESSAGGKVTDASLRGSVAVIDFFGSWNIPSRTWQPLLNAGIKDDAEIKVFAAAVRERSAEAGIKALRDRGIEWPMLNPADKLARDLGIKMFPATVVVGKDGKVSVFQNCRGEESVEKIRQAITQAKK